MRVVAQIGGGRVKVVSEVVVESWPMTYVSDVQEAKDELMSEAEDVTKRSGDMMERSSQRKRLPRRILLQKSYTRPGLYVQKE